MQLYLNDLENRSPGKDATSRCSHLATCVQNLLIRELSQCQCGRLVERMGVHGTGDFKSLGQFLQARENCHQERRIKVALGTSREEELRIGGQGHWKEHSLSVWTLQRRPYVWYVFTVGKIPFHMVLQRLWFCSILRMDKNKQLLQNANKLWKI